MNKHILLKALARCRLITDELIEHGLHVSLEAVDDCLKEKLITKEKDSQNSYYILTEIGEQYVRQELPEIGHLYRGFVVEQDIVLANFYCKLDEEGRETWRTKDDYIVQYQLSGTVDASYINKDKECVGIKVLNVNSGFSVVERVEKFVKEVNIPHMYYLHYKTA